MELFQLRRQRVARAAVRIGKDQQHAFAAKLLQRQLAAVESWQAEIRCWRARLQSVAFDSAARHGTITKPSGAIPIFSLSLGERAGVRASVDLIRRLIVRQTFRLARFPKLQLVQPFLQFLDPQKHPAVLA